MLRVIVIRVVTKIVNFLAERELLLLYVRVVLAGRQGKCVALGKV